MLRRKPTRRALSALTPLFVFAGVLATLALTDSGEPAGSSSPASAESLAADSESVEALVDRATAGLVGHDFAGGLALAERAHQAAPKLAATYPPLIDGLIETGAYRRAAAEIERLLNLKPGVAAYTRLSYFEELHGNPGAALRAMRLAATSALPGSEARVFALTLVGDLLFDRGAYPRARAAYGQALAERAGHPAAEAGLLNVLSAQGQTGRAIAGYLDLVEGRGLVEYADELGRLEQAAGRATEARTHYAVLAELHGEELARGASPDAGQVLFEADHGSPGFGIELGARVWESAPSVASADAYSWALLAAGQTKRAARLSKSALRLGTRDPLFLFHAGVIAVESGEEGRGRNLLRRVLRVSPGFDPLFAAIAERRLERLG